MKCSEKNNLPFLIPTILFWIIGIILISQYAQVELHQLIAGYRTGFLDAFMPYYTEMGGLLPWIVIVLLLFIRFKDALLVFVTQLLATLVVQPLKYTIDADRPKRVFESLQLALPHVEGVKLHASLSFPSGHTAAAFACLFSLAFLVKKPCLKFLFFVLALLAAYSRVYLSQHFTADVLAGSVIGVAVTYIYYLNHTSLNNKWMQKSLLNLKKE